MNNPMICSSNITAKVASFCHITKFLTFFSLFFLKFCVSLHPIIA